MLITANPSRFRGNNGVSRWRTGLMLIRIRLSKFMPFGSDNKILNLPFHFDRMSERPINNHSIGGDERNTDQGKNEHDPQSPLA